MNIYQYKGINIVGYDEKNKKIEFMPSYKEKDCLIEFKSNYLRNEFEEVLILRYFLGKNIYQNSGIEERIKCEKNSNTSYDVFAKSKIEEFLKLKKIPVEILEEIIGYDKKYFPTDIFKVREAQVKSNGNIIVQVKFNFKGIEFIDNNKRIFACENDLEEYVRFAFWGTAVLNGKKIIL